jgi:pSer/pThr/pTyr-binding forkhead associated (FHA) protein
MTKSKNNEDIPVFIGFEGDLDNQRWMLDQPLIIGRDAACNITIPNRQVSRHHAKLTPTTDGVVLEDLRSKNGTHKNGERVTSPILLSDGDIVHIALAQKFVFMSADATLPLEGDKTSTIELDARTRLYLEKKSHRVWIGDQEILPPLSASQFKLLEILYANNGQLVSREEIMSAVWGEADVTGVSEQALDALVRRLRERLASVDPKQPYVLTIRGHGLRLDNPIEDVH